MEISDLIKKYGIFLQTKFVPGTGIVETGMIGISYAADAKKDGCFETIVNAKPEIIAYLRADAEAEKKAAEERKAKIDAIPGLKEIQDARDDLESWHREFDESFRDVGGLGVRVKPVYDFDLLYTKYPRAYAYLKAEQYKNASNYAKSAAGCKALEAIIDGADPDETISAMEKEWSDYCDEHIWD